MVFSDTIQLDSQSSEEWRDITEMVQRSVTQSGVANGIVTLCALHTTAAITVNENGDPDVEHDLFAKLRQLIPNHESYYRHFEGNSDAHVKSSLIGVSQTVSIVKGSLVLGTWQSIYFCEFDGPRRGRSVQVTILGNS